MPRRPLSTWLSVACVAAAISVMSSIAAPAVASANAPSPSELAWQWILGQRGSGTAVTSQSTIASDRSYPSSWTGAVSGTFTPVGVTSPVENPSSIVVDSPSEVGADFAGIVAGHVTVAPQQGRWIVQAYRDTSSGRVQVPLQALVDAQGNFSIDLGNVADPPAGSWVLGLLDAESSYAPSGTPWPAAPVYRDWEIQAYVVTDTAYLIGAQPAKADGTFAFNSSQPGTKVFRLVDSATGAVLAEQSPDFGLVRSYSDGTRTYSYDQALAVLAGTALDAPETAQLTQGLLALQAPDGGFVDSADARNPSAGLAIERTGVAAVATYALLRRLQITPQSDPDHATLESATTAGLNWLEEQVRDDGLVGAGTGDYTADGALEPTVDPAWVSTEHNLDTWQTFHLATQVLGGLWAARAASLANAIVTRLWSQGAGRFLEGLNDNGHPDATDPLDVNSWGAVFLTAIGDSGRAAAALAHTASFTSTVDGASGYRAYYPQPAFPAARDNVWTEGSAGVVLADERAGQDAAAASGLADLTALQRVDGSFPSALASDASTSMTTEPSVAGTAWYILVSGSPPGIWQ